MDLTTHGWDNEVRLDIGRALLSSGYETLIPRELAEPSGRDVSNVKSCAETMASEGLLRRESASRPQPGPGRKARYAYGFAPGQDEAVLQLVRSRDEVGRLRQGQQLVFAEAELVEDLFHLLSDPALTRSASWYAAADGRGTGYLIVFEASAADEAMTLVASLQTLGIRCWRAGVSQVGAAAELVAQAQKATTTASGARMRQRARLAANS
jgi:hypothetical protein